jgi:hypothetical protein
MGVLPHLTPVGAYFTSMVILIFRQELASLLWPLPKAFGAGRFGKSIRRRLRSVILKQWQTFSGALPTTPRAGVDRRLAFHTAKSNHGPWRLAKSPALAMALPNAYFVSLAIPISSDSKAYWF